MKYNIEAKASMHVGKKYSLKHNLREYDANKWNTDGHIQSDRSHLNERLTHTELRDFLYTILLTETYGSQAVKDIMRIKTL